MLIPDNYLTAVEMFSETFLQGPSNELLSLEL